MALCISAVPGQSFPTPGTGVYTWEPVASRTIKASAIAFGPTGRLYATSDTVYVFEPASEGPPAGQWRVLGRPRLGINAVLALDPAGDTLLVGRGGNLLARSTDGGATWTDVNGDYSGNGSGGPNRPGGFFVLPVGHPYAGRLLAGALPIYSGDRGATWVDAAYNTAPIYASSRIFALIPSGRIVMAGFYGISTSDDGGQSYAATSVYGNHIVDGLTALATPGSIQAGAPACHLPEAALCEGAVAVGIVGNAPHVQAWRTNDGGRTWTDGYPLPQPEDGIGVALVAGVVDVGRGPDGLGRAVAVLGRGLVYATADGEQSWAAVGRMPLHLTEGAHWTSYVLLGPDGHLWAVSERAGPAPSEVYRTAEPAMAAFAVSSAPEPEEAGGLGLDVRPNPASSAVEVGVLLPTAQAVRVVVLDAQGREVAVAFDGAAGAGRTAVRIDTSAWPAGVYAVRAVADEVTATARLVVAR